jgi:hypothetical protein
MFRKLSLAAAAASTLALVPAAAQANHRDGYYDGGRYQESYRGERYGRYDDRYYGRSNVRYDGRRCKGTTGMVIGGVGGALLGREVTRNRYRGRSGTTGAILGGAIGALAGRAVQKSGCR